MHFHQLLAASAAFAALSIATPLGTDFGSVDTQETTITRQGTGRKYLRNGIKAMAKTYRKFGMPVPENIKVAEAAAQSNPTGTVSAEPEMYDQEYLSPVEIGTPAQTLMLDFDTGSSDLWVFSNQLSPSLQEGHSVYNPFLSSTAKEMTGSTWRISYGDQSGAQGNVYTDKVCVGGVSVTTQAVEAAQSISAQFQRDTSLDGILGLAGPRANQISPVPQFPFFRNVRASLYQAVFASYLKPGTAGAYDFGFVNPAHYTGNIYYTPTTRYAGFWDITPSDYRVDGTEYPSPGLTIVDTGTVSSLSNPQPDQRLTQAQSLIFLPDEVLNNYYNQIPGAYYSNTQGGALVPCNANMPDLVFTISNAQRTVPGAYINYAPLMDGSGYCYGGLQSSYGLPFGILGDVFIKSQYVVFDAYNKRIGFADQK